MKIKITQSDHIHAGQAVALGTVLDVDDITASWLVKHQIGEASAPPAPATEAKTEPKPEPAKASK